VRDQLLGKLLRAAADSGVIEAVHAALDAGADVNSANVLGITALHKSAYRGYLPIVQLLLDKGADRKMVTLRQHKTALDYARDAGNHEVAAILNTPFTAAPT
jgi:uncharacterized protein